jgi:hypothetical protein
LDIADLRALDTAGFESILALAYARNPRQQTHASPHAFVCSDGATYWVKSRAQNGLSAELIAGRLAGKLGVGASAKIVEVPAQALPPRGAADHLLGVGVGSRDLGGFNPRELHEFLAEGHSFDAGVVDPASRASAIVFQTWIQAEDSQVLIDAATGRVVSIDHGAALGGGEGDLTVIVTDIPGVAPTLGKDARLLRRAVESIEALTDKDLLRFCACIPDSPNWNASTEHRLQLAQWLRNRQTRLQEVISAWART